MSGAIGGPTGAWVGGPVGERATCILAPNPGPMTLDGTNTWLLHEPGSPVAAVVDPGPLGGGHRERLLDAVRYRGARVDLVLLTHGHHDHSEGAAELAQEVGAPVLALDPAHRLGSEGLVDGDVLTAGGVELRVVATPGHTSDSLSFVLPAERALLTGDTVLGRGTTVVAHPDGVLADYLDSLLRLRELAAAGVVDRVLPGHGPALADAAGVIDAYLAHRQERLEQVRRALAAGATSPREVVEAVYADVDRSLWPAAELSVRAQLEHLRSRG